MPAHQTLVVGAFRVDVVNEQLWHGQEVYHLTHKAFAVLHHLMTHPR